MRSFLASVVVILVLAVAMAYVLNGAMQKSAAEVYSTSGARVGDPGHNLIGPNYGA